MNKTNSGFNRHNYRRANRRGGHQLVLPVFVAVFCLGHFKALASAQNNAPTTNQQFIETSLVASATEFLSVIKARGNAAIWLSTSASNGRDQAAQFAQDVLLRHLVDAGIEIFLNHTPEASSTDSLYAKRGAGVIETVLDQWQFVAQRNENNEIEQSFQFQMRYRILDASNKIIDAGKIAGQQHRGFSDLENYRAAQQGQPVFAQCEARFSTEKNNLLNTIIISGITGLTVFLIYSLRSQ